ncbi:MAG TPA: biotin transporter BioY [Candidatus Blautia intestinigallinarum]|nr:biotin transporter BioY [Candidatus Blautia intestinigallinarum]
MGQTEAVTDSRVRNKTRDIVYTAFFAVLIAVGSWISIPMTVPFTLQTFAVFVTLGILGGRRGTMAVLLYILLGAVGIPVFSGFTGGVGILLGNTGGYIAGFLLTGFIFWGMQRMFGRSLGVQVISMLLGLISCYFFGTVWFLLVYMRNGSTVSVVTVLGWCVIPFIVPDLVKLGLALTVARRVSRYAGIERI